MNFNGVKQTSVCDVPLTEFLIQITSPARFPLGLRLGLVDRLREPIYDTKSQCRSPFDYHSAPR